jgi:hypothetical protein
MISAFEGIGNTYNTYNTYIRAGTPLTESSVSKCGLLWYLSILKSNVLWVLLSAHCHLSPQRRRTTTAGIHCSNFGVLLLLCTCIHFLEEAVQSKLELERFFPRSYFTLHGATLWLDPGDQVGCGGRKGEAKPGIFQRASNTLQLHYITILYYAYSVSVKE